MKLLVYLFSILPFTFGLSSCAVLPHTDAYDPVPGFKEHSSPPPIATQPPEIQPQKKMEGALPLDRCVAIALANNPEVAATNWEVDVAGAKLDQAKAARWPTFTYEGSYLKNLNSRPLFEVRYNGEKRIFSKQITRGDLVMKLPLFTGGRIINEIKAAELIRLAELNRLSRTRDELVFNVSSTFYSILSQDKVVESLKFSLQAMQEQRRKMARMVEVAKAAHVDLMRTEVRVADIEQQLVKEENIREIQKRVLANLMGQDFEKASLKISGELSFVIMALSTEKLVPKALEQRPDFNAARERLESQARKVDVARAGHYPNVSLVGSYGYRGTGVTGSVLDDRGLARRTNYNARGPFYDQDGQIGMLASIPIFEGGRITAKVREEVSALGAAQERLRKLNLQICQEVESAVLDVSSSTERVKALEKAIEQARESLRVETLKYNLGAGTITDVLDAQAAQLVTETSYYRALADLRIAVARLKLAVGGNLT